MGYIIKVGRQYVVKRESYIMGADSLSLTSDVNKATIYTTKSIAEAFASDYREVAYHHGHKIHTVIVRIGEG